MGNGHYNMKVKTDIYVHKTGKCSIVVSRIEQTSHDDATTSGRARATPQRRTREPYRGCDVTVQWQLDNLGYLCS